MGTPEDRRTRIAEAAITVLGRHGSRGLTHRAVDSTAGLSTGSTSYYFRSRAALLEAAVQRLEQLDVAALEPADDEDTDDLLARVVADALQGAGRVRTLARYELVLEAVRRPALRDALASGTRRLTEHLACTYLTDSSDEARVRARDALAFLDGLLLADVTAPPGEGEDPSVLVARLTRFIHQPRG